MTTQQAARRSLVIRRRFVVGAFVFSLLLLTILSEPGLGRSGHRSHRRTSTSAWTRPMFLTSSFANSRYGLRTAGDLSTPFVAVSRAGSSEIVWAQGRERHCSIHARSRSASGQLAPTQLITAPGEGDVNCFFQAVSSPAGATVIVWGHSGINLRVGSTAPKFVRLLSPSGQLSPIQQLFNPGNYEVLDVAIDANGRATVLLQTHSGARDVVYVQRVESNGALDPPIAVAVIDDPAVLYSLNPTSGTVGTDRNGDVVLSWIQGDQNGSPGQLWVRTLSSNGTLGAAIQAYGFNTRFEDPGYALAVAPNGQVTIQAGSAYDSRGFPTGLAARVLTSSGALGRIQSVVPGGLAAASSGNTMDLVGLSDGTSVAAFLDHGHRGARLEVRTITAAGLGPVRTVATASCGHCMDYQLAASGTRSIAFWQTQSRYGIQYSAHLRTVSNTGSLGATQTRQTDSFRGRQPQLTAVAANATGQAILLLHQGRSLYITSGHVS